MLLGLFPETLNGCFLKITSFIEEQVPKALTLSWLEAELLDEFFI